MFGHNIYDSYSYSRPVSYQSYNTRIFKPYLLNDADDQESDTVKNLLSKSRFPFDRTETLTRGIRWNGYTFGKRRFNHNSSEVEYYIHQWRDSNHLSKVHLTGTLEVYHTFDSFIKNVEKLVFTPPPLL